MGNETRDQGEVSGGGGSIEGYCCHKRESHVYPGESGRDNWEGQGIGEDGARRDGMCWEGAGGRCSGNMRMRRFAVNSN